jgi:hypothetical protein
MDMRMRIPRRSQPGPIASESASVIASASAGGFPAVPEGVAIRGRRVATLALLAVVVFAVAAMSFSGLFSFFTGPMHWTHGHSLLGPVSLDVAAVVVYGFALDRIEKGESGAQFRLMALVLVGLSAFINWRGALASGNVSEELFFPVMSVMVYWMAHAILGARRRDARRAQHGYKAKAKLEPLPPFGALVWVPWVGAPVDALRALREAVRKRLTAAPTTRNRKTASPPASASATLTASAATHTLAPPPASASESATRTVPATSASATRTLASPPPAASDASGVASASASVSATRITPGGGHGSQSAAIRLAIATLRAERDCEPDASDVVTYLKDQGRPVLIGRVNDVMRRDSERALSLVTREEVAG